MQGGKAQGGWCPSLASPSRGGPPLHPLQWAAAATTCTRLTRSCARPPPHTSQLFKNCLLAQGFQEIHTPKLIAGASEGGAAVFRRVGEHPGLIDRNH